MERLPPHVEKAAERYKADNGVPVGEVAGTERPALIELFLFVAGYLDEEPALASRESAQGTTNSMKNGSCSR